MVSCHLCQTYAVIQPLLQNKPCTLSLGWLMKMSIVNFIIVLYFCSMCLQQKNQFTFKTGKFPTWHEAPVCLYMSGNPCVYLLRKCACVSHKISWIVKQKISKHAYKCKVISKSRFPFFFFILRNHMRAESTSVLRYLQLNCI